MNGLSAVESAESSTVDLDARKIVQDVGMTYEAPEVVGKESTDFRVNLLNFSTSLETAARFHRARWRAPNSLRMICEQQYIHQGEMMLESPISLSASETFLPSSLPLWLSDGVTAGVRGRLGDRQAAVERCYIW